MQLFLSESCFQAFLFWKSFKDLNGNWECRVIGMIKVMGRFCRKLIFIFEVVKIGNFFKGVFWLRNNFGLSYHCIFTKISLLNLYLKSSYTKFSYNFYWRFFIFSAIISETNFQKTLLKNVITFLSICFIKNHSQFLLPEFRKKKKIKSKWK